MRMCFVVPLAFIPLLLASCGGGESGGGDGNPPTANAPPTFTSLQTARVAENGTAAYQAAARDPANAPPPVSFHGGIDPAPFTTPPSGRPRLTDTPAYSFPGDPDGNTDH